MKSGYQEICSSKAVKVYMSVKQRRILLKTFIDSQFGYSSLIWMFHSRRINSKTSYLHERSLRTVYKDNYSS